MSADIALDASGGPLAHLNADIQANAGPWLTTLGLLVAVKIFGSWIRKLGPRR